jgi:ABC-type cobalamin/Fe3+-siderophores transport system ATPase subunit
LRLDWNWPKRCDRAAFEALMSLDFLKDATNVVLVGPNGVGKSTLARNVAYQALIHGHTVLFTRARANHQAFGGSLPEFERQFSPHPQAADAVSGIDAVR